MMQPISKEEMEAALSRAESKLDVKIDNLLTINIDYVDEPNKLLKMVATVKVRGEEILNLTLSGSDVMENKEINKVAVLNLIEECKNYALQFHHFHGGGYFGSSKES